MKVAIHQPQYIPWLPYFLKIDESDLFVILDSVDFQKNGLQNRNQIKTGQGPLWLTVPVRQSLGQKIVDTAIDNKADWRTKHWRTIGQSYAKAAAFADYQAELAAVFERPWDSLAELNVELTRRMMGWLGIDTPVVRSSTLKAEGTSSDLVLAICREIGATTYVSGSGALAYLRPDDFAAAGIAVEFRDPPPIAAYPQTFPKAGFVPNLSALDIILNCGSTWRRYLV